MPSRHATVRRRGNINKIFCHRSHRPIATAKYSLSDKFDISYSSLMYERMLEGRTGVFS